MNPRIKTLINPITFCIAFQFLVAEGKLEARENSVITFCQQAPNLIESAFENNISPFILASIIYTESRWDPSLKSHKGACGLAQVIPKYFGVTCATMIQNPDLAIETGAFAFSTWKKHAKGDRHKALQCYSSGNKCSYPLYANNVISNANILKKTYERLIK